MLIILVHRFITSRIQSNGGFVLTRRHHCVKWQLLIFIDLFELDQQLFLKYELINSTINSCFLISSLPNKDKDVNSFQQLATVLASLIV
jgi:hypothetical protein